MNAGCDGLFRRFVAVGDSLSQGAQNVGVSIRSQPCGVPALLAAQAGCRFRQPYLAEPGFPPHIDRMGDVFRARLTHPELMVGQRLDPEAEVDNFAIAGARLQDVVRLSCSELRTLARTYAVARLARLTLNPLARPDWEPRTPLDFAIAAEPTAVLCWIGANDVLEAFFYPRWGFTPVEVFGRLLRHALERLMAETRAVVILPTLPDVTRAPLLWAWCKRHPRLAERARGRLAAFNEMLVASDRPDHRVCVVDIRPAFDHHVEHGLPVDGAALPFRVDQQRLTFGPLRGRPGRLTGGGLVSYDGLHPTHTGYALLVNVLIEQLNARLATSLPAIDLTATAAADPLLRRPDPYHWAALRAYCEAAYGPGVARLARSRGDGPGL